MTSVNFSIPRQPVDWRVVVLDTTASTNDECRTLGPWEAVQALRQSAGRGRRGRKFACGPGGLWISANIPSAGLDLRGAALHVGVALQDALRPVAELSLRWPNDLLLNGKKVAGLLLENFGGGCLTIGLGLNVRNEPWIEMPELSSTATNLAGLGDPPPLEGLRMSALNAFAVAFSRIRDSGLAGAVADWNRAAPLPVRVGLALRSGVTIHGSFQGLDADGDLRVLEDSGGLRIVPHEDVERLHQEINLLDNDRPKT